MAGINYSHLFVQAFDDFEEKLKKERAEKLHDLRREIGNQSHPGAEIS